MSYELRQPEQIAVWNKRMASANYQQHEPEYQLLARTGKPHTRMHRVLDIGCGWGRHLVHFAELGWVVTGLDWSTVALNHAREQLEDRGLHGDLVRSDFRKLPFNQAEFQLVIAIDVLQHCRLTDFRRAILEIKRVLRVGGTAIISIPSIKNAPHRGTGFWADDCTVVLVDGVEAGIPHHFFSREELQYAVRMFRGSKIEAAVEQLPVGVAPLHPDHLNEWYWLTLKG